MQVINTEGSGEFHAGRELESLRLLAQVDGTLSSDDLVGFVRRASKALRSDRADSARVLSRGLQIGEELALSNAAYTNILHALRNHGFVHEASDFSERVRVQQRLQLDFASYYATLRVQTEARRFDAAISTLEALEAAMPLTPHMRQVAYGKVIGAAVEHRWDVARRLLDVMLRRGTSPTRELYARLRHGCQVHGESESWLQQQLEEHGVLHPEALGLFEEPVDVSEEEVEASSESAKTVAPPEEEASTLENLFLHGDRASIQRLLRRFQRSGRPFAGLTAAYNRLIRMAVDAGALEEAVSSKRAMEAAGVLVRESTYHTLLSGCAQRGAVALAEQLVAEMRSKGMTPTLLAYNALMTAYAAHGQDDRMQSVFVQLRRDGLEPDTVSYNLMVRLAVARKRMRRAERIVQQMESQGSRTAPSLRTFVMLLGGYAKSGDAEAAQSVFDRMMRLHRAGRLDAMNAAPYQALMNAYASQGKVDQVTSWMLQMEAAGLPRSQSVYNALVTAYIARGDAAKAHELVRSGSIPHDTITYNLLLHEAAMKGPDEAVDALVGEMETAGVELSSHTVNSLIAGFMKRGRVDRGWLWFNRLRALGLSPTVHTFNALVHGCGPAGAVPLAVARQMLRRMEDARVRPNGLTFYLMMHKSEDLECVRSLLLEMAALAVPPDANHLSPLIRVLAASGERSSASDSAALASVIENELKVLLAAVAHSKESDVIRGSSLKRSWTREALYIEAAKAAARAGVWDVAEWLLLSSPAPRDGDVGFGGLQDILRIALAAEDGGARMASLYNRLKADPRCRRGLNYLKPFLKAEVFPILSTLNISSASAPN